MKKKKILRIYEQIEDAIEGIAGEPIENFSALEDTLYIGDVIFQQLVLYPNKLDTGKLLLNRDELELSSI